MVFLEEYWRRKKRDFRRRIWTGNDVKKKSRRKIRHFWRMNGGVNEVF